MKFKVGDRVKAVGNETAEHYLQTGVIDGVRTKPYAFPYHVTFPDGAGVPYHENDLIPLPVYGGHPRFLELMDNAIALHSAKNKDYAQGGNPLGNFQRVSAIKKLYKGLPWDSPTGTAIDYMLKQLDAALNMYANGYEGEIEGFEKRMMDVCVYSPLIIINKEEETKQ